MEICLYQTSIPSNLGAIIRTAACFNIKKIGIIMPTSFPLEEKKIESALDYKSKVEMVKYLNWEDFLNKTTNQSSIILATKHAEKPYYKESYDKNSILLFGNESYGVPEKVSYDVSKKVSIPMMDDARSLNLATSVAIVISEAMRQIHYNFNTLA